jgi:hypothetical protein
VPTDPRRGRVPPPPPSWSARLRSWVRRLDRRGARWQLLGAATVLGGVVGWLAVGGLGLLLQPRFTVLELAAQRLAPESGDAQPPVELVGPDGAFDRGYTVRFPTPSGGLMSLLDRAAAQRWRVVSRSRPGQATLEREGVVAVVRAGPAVTTVRTRVAARVRDLQRLARRVGLVAGALLAAGWVWQQVRRHPRAV